MIEAYPDPAGIIQVGCRFVAGNAGLDGLLEGRTLGRTVLQATRSADLDDLAGRALAGSSTRAEVTLPALDNRLVQAVLEPLPGKRALLLLRDLTALKRAEAMRRDFVANASHELRTPVSAISGAVETLQGMSLADGARQFVEMIARQAGRMSRLTNDLLDLSRLEAGQWPLEVGTYEILPICDATVQLVKDRASAKAIHVGLDVPSALSVRIPGPGSRSGTSSASSNGSTGWTAAGLAPTAAAAWGWPSSSISRRPRAARWEWKADAAEAGSG